jgi:hypothetical protein
VIGTHWHTFQQLIYFLLRHLLAKLCEDVAKFTNPDESILFLVEYFEATDELFGCSGWFESVGTVQDL